MRLGKERLRSIGYDRHRYPPVFLSMLVHSLCADTPGFFSLAKRAFVFVYSLQVMVLMSRRIQRSVFSRYDRMSASLKWLTTLE